MKIFMSYLFLVTQSYELDVEIDIPRVYHVLVHAIREHFWMCCYGDSYFSEVAKGKYWAVQRARVTHSSALEILDYGK